MKSIENIVNNAVSSMIESGKLEELITLRLEKTIESCINDSMKDYSDFGRAIKDKINESIQCSGNNVELPQYNKFIAQVINDKFSDVLKKEGVIHLEELVGSVIKPVNKQEKISTLLDEIQESFSGVARENGLCEIEISASNNDDETAIYAVFVCPDYGDEVKATFYNFNRNGSNDWHIGYINEDGESLVSRSADISKTATNGITDILYKYWAMGTKFEMDVEISSIDVTGY